jgi:hypothetical protein
MVKRINQTSVPIDTTGMDPEMLATFHQEAQRRSLMQNILSPFMSALKGNKPSADKASVRTVKQPPSTGGGSAGQ